MAIKVPCCKIYWNIFIKRLYAEWCVAQSHKKARNTATWEDFAATMEHYYKPKQNPTLKNFQFRSLTQHKDEIFPSFCNRVQKEAIYCKFKCDHNHCTADDIAIRNQILTKFRDNNIRQEALKKSWDLKQLRHSK